MYDTTAEAKQKLHTCIVAYDDKPFYISDIEGLPGAVTLYGNECQPKSQGLGSVVKNGIVSHPISDPKWEFKNLGGRLGYVNVELGEYTSASYVRRIPVRAAQRTQGLSSQNVRLSRLPPCKALDLSGTGVTWGKVTGLPGFLDTWAGTFPDMKSVRTQMKKPAVTMRAIGRFLAVQRSPLEIFYLMYKGEPIGHTEDLETFKVPKAFRYLDELLVEDHNLKIQ